MPTEKCTNPLRLINIYIIMIIFFLLLFGFFPLILRPFEFQIEAGFDFHDIFCYSESWE